MYNSEIAKQLYEAITLLIENGIFHNDIRHTNIMLDSNGTVRLVDYDSAKLAYIDNPETDIRQPILTMKEYDEFLSKSYTIILDEKKYRLAFPLEMQERHIKARKKFENLILSNFILGLGF
jgi:serine/threonine protein kinase